MQFSFKAIDQNGKIVSGDHAAENEKDVALYIRTRGMLPLDINPGYNKKRLKGLLKINISQILKKKIRSFQLDTMTKQLAVLINAGLPIDRALGIMVNITPSPLKEILSQLLINVKKGRSLSDAMSDSPEAFPDFYQNMVFAGEESATLGQVLKKLAENMQRLAMIKAQLLNALIYPFILFIISGLSILILMIYVVPKFVSMFAEMGTSLPFTTRLLMQISAFLQNGWWFFIILIIGLAFGFKQIRTNTKIEHKWDELKIKLPVVGNILIFYEISRFTRTLSTLLSSGIPLLKAVNIVKNIVQNTILFEILKDAEEMLRAGKPFSAALKGKGFFPHMVLEMIVVGEEAGQLQFILEEVAEQYEMELAEHIKRALTLIEPVVILIMGFLVGFIVLSMLSAVFSINDIAF